MFFFVVRAREARGAKGRERSRLHGRCGGPDSVGSFLRSNARGRVTSAALARSTRCAPAANPPPKKTSNDGLPKIVCQRTAWGNVRRNGARQHPRISLPRKIGPKQKQKILRIFCSGVPRLLLCTSEMDLFTGEQYVRAWGPSSASTAPSPRPEKMSDHFKGCTPMNAFWIRGQSVSVTACMPSAEDSHRRGCRLWLAHHRRHRHPLPVQRQVRAHLKNMPVKCSFLTCVPEVLMTGAFPRISQYSLFPALLSHRRAASLLFQSFAQSLAASLCLKYA